MGLVLDKMMPDPASPRPLSRRQQEMAERKEQEKSAPNGKEACILEEATMPVLEEDYDSCAEYVYNDLLKRTGDEHLNVYHKASRFSGLLYLLPEAKMESAGLFKLTRHVTIGATRSYGDAVVRLLPAFGESSEGQF